MVFYINNELIGITAGVSIQLKILCIHINMNCSTDVTVGVCVCVCARGRACVIGYNNKIAVGVFSFSHTLVRGKRKSFNRLRIIQYYPVASKTRR